MCSACKSCPLMAAAFGHGRAKPKPKRPAAKSKHSTSTRRPKRTTKSTARR